MILKAEEIGRPAFSPHCQHCWSCDFVENFVILREKMKKYIWEICQMLEGNFAQLVPGLIARLD